MKKIVDLNLGFSDAENYKRRENRELFNTIFVKNTYLEHILRPNTFFIIGEKGTGKTAYAVYLSINNYKETSAEIKYLRETDYEKFVILKKEKHLQLSDYTSIWKVIILLLLAKSIRSEEISSNPFSKNKKITALLQAIDDYYANAFSPEIIYALNWIENSKIAAELVSKYLKLGGEESSSANFQESKFQVNLLYIQNEFEKAINDIKIKRDHLLFIDGIDIRPGLIPYKDYLDCVKGLANAVWSLNNDFFPRIKDSDGRFRAILLVRPDIFNSLGLQNPTNKILDNSVYLDWRTTYPNFNNSYIYELSDRLLSSQQEEILPFGAAWNHYFPWKATSTSLERDYDHSYLGFLRLSYSRPRDIVSMIRILQELVRENQKYNAEVFTSKSFESHEFLNKYSEYMMGGIKDQLSFYYNNTDYDGFLKFFIYLNGRYEFGYDEYVKAYDKFIDFILDNHPDIPEFVESKDSFLQFLYDTNIICYIDDIDYLPLFRWCYRERSPSNISPKVKQGVRYRIHQGLHKALNVGSQKTR